MNPNVTWEYKILKLDVFGQVEIKLPEWETMLNAAGAEGWELTTVQAKEGTIFAYLCRKVLPPTEITPAQ
jgi:Domain of unknown function (DUF4177)